MHAIYIISKTLKKKKVTIHKIVKKKKRGKQAKPKRNDSSKNKKWVSYHE
jgi:hypothetical protein